jgi:D-3-phosphoglycerate dehydrogenase
VFLLNEVRVLVSDTVEIDHFKLGPRFKVDYRPGISREELLGAIGDYDALVVRSRTRVDREVLEKGTRLKLVARPGTGLDNVDQEAAKVRGVSVVNSPEAPVEAVAELVVMMMLALSRRLTVADAGLKGEKWSKEGLMGQELRGRTLGIVGMGRIGRRVAELAGAFRMAILGYDTIEIPRDVTEELHVRMCGLDELISSSDFVTLHVPLLDSTKHLINAGRLATMKKGSYVINASRGGVIDEKALSDALNEGRLGGAALDVFENEPPSGEILRASNIIVTPHIGGQTEEAQIAAIEVIAQKLESAFSDGGNR